VQQFTEFEHRDERSTTASQTITASVSQATTTAGADTNLKSLIPTPANTARTDGPDSIHDNGIHLHFLAMDRRPM
jgi:hypothetical protein